jgi:short-subunit dehydrogenase
MIEKILISGNPKTGLAEALYKLYPNATFCSRENGYDLTQGTSQQKFATLAVEHNVIIICSALWKFQQTVLLDEVYKTLTDNNKSSHIICIGSTTDRVKNGKAWRYNAEKKALRDYSNTLSISGVWGNTPKVSYISFGTLSNNQHKHLDRKCLDIYEAAEYIKWLINQPKYVNINEMSIDPMQGDNWHE